VEASLRDPWRCYENFRMNNETFHKLHKILVVNHGLQSSQEFHSIEAVGTFLWACGHGHCMRQVKDRLRRGLGTVSQKFGEVLRAMVSFADTVIRPKDPTYSTVHGSLQPLTFIRRMHRRNRWNTRTCVCLGDHMMITPTGKVGQARMY